MVVNRQGYFINCNSLHFNYHNLDCFFFFMSLSLKIKLFIKLQLLTVQHMGRFDSFFPLTLNLLEFTKAVSFIKAQNNKVIVMLLNKYVKE